jgi:hypothetical protein
MEFNNVDNGSSDFPNTGGGLYGGLEFFQGGSENSWLGLAGATIPGARLGARVTWNSIHPP